MCVELPYMKKELSQITQANIRKFIEVILCEVELRDIKPRNEMTLVSILSKKFEHPNDLENILERINEGEKHKIVSVVFKSDVDQIKPCFEGSLENLAELEKVRHLHFMNHEFEQEKYFYFLIKDLERLKEIKETTDKALVVPTDKRIILKIDTEAKTITRDDRKKLLQFSFRKVRGRNKRFNYLIKIAESPFGIIARKLDTTTSQNISSEIAKTNKETKKLLKLPEYLIVNKGGSGYKINRAIYDVEFV